MTNDEAIYTLKNTAFLGWSEQAEKVSEAVQMAVEALKRETSGDAISRYNAIDALMEILDRPNHAEFLYTDEICKVLNELPSVQPEERTEERTKTHACDCISRHAAIDVLAAMQGRCTSKAALIQNSKIWQQIKDLPSAQPEPCNDAISRQAVKEMMCVKHCTAYPTCQQKYGCYKTHDLELLPSVQPVAKDINVSCKDAVSRQVAIDICHKNYDGILDFRSDGRTVALSFEDIINSVPSVQPGIIHCRDCISYQEGIDINGKPFTRCNGSVRTYGHTLPDWYCADAERRTDGRD